MPKKNCLNCIAYCNMLADGKCGLGFEVEEVTETSAGFSIAVQPVDECTVAMPRTRKDFVKKAAERGIEWDLRVVSSIGPVDKGPQNSIPML